MGSSFIFACPESGEKFAVGKDWNAVRLPASRLQTDAQITLELFLLAQGAQGFEILRGDVFFGLRLYCRMIVDDEIHLEAAGGPPKSQRRSRHVIAAAGQLGHPKCFKGFLEFRRAGKE